MEASSQEDVPGCTDVASCTFNPEATVDDGSCQYEDVCGNCGGDAYAVTDDMCNYDWFCVRRKLRGGWEWQWVRHRRHLRMHCAVGFRRQCDFVSCLVFGCDDPNACNYDAMPSRASTLNSLTIVMESA